MLTKSQSQPKTELKPKAYVSQVSLVQDKPKPQFSRDQFQKGHLGDCDFIKAQLSHHQQDTIGICKVYDNLKLKRNRFNGGIDPDPNLGEFGLIRRSIQTITCLEELIQYSVFKIIGMNAEIAKVSRENQEANEQLQENV